MKNKNLTFILIGFLIVGTIFLSACTKEKEELTFEAGETVSAEKAREIAEDFINDYLMMDDTKVSVRFLGSAYNMYHLKVDIGTGEAIDSFITKDGRLFFPQHLDIEEIKEINSPEAEENLGMDIEIPKSERPIIEMFVMTYCPYGTQIQKGILPVLKVLDNNIDFRQMYVDYAMQDKKELDENLLQYCIQKEGDEELIAYLECFLAEENQSENCFNQVVNNPSGVNSCLEETDNEFKITENYEQNIDWRGNFPGFNVHLDEVNKYNVSGSPTLIINGVEVPAHRDPASLLNVICDAFEEKPEGCDSQLSNTAPAPGFGLENSGTNTVATCG